MHGNVNSLPCKRKQAVWLVRLILLCNQRRTEIMKNVKLTPIVNDHAEENLHAEARGNVFRVALAYEVCVW